MKTNIKHLSPPNLQSTFNKFYNLTKKCENPCKSRDFRQLSESICVYITVSNLGNTLSLFLNPASDKVDVAVGTTDSFTDTDSENAQTSYSVLVTNNYGVPVFIHPENRKPLYSGHKQS